MIKHTQTEECQNNKETRDYCKLTFFNSDQQIPDTPIETELERAFKANKEANILLDYKLRSNKQQRNITSNVEDEDVQSLCILISGGYIQKDFGLYLSYSQFRQRLSQFDIMRNIYQDVQRKYKNRKIEETQIKFRSLLLMVYLEENQGKFTKTKIDELFHNHRLVQ